MTVKASITAMMVFLQLTVSVCACQWSTAFSAESVSEKAVAVCPCCVADPDASPELPVPHDPPCRNCTDRSWTQAFLWEPAASNWIAPESPSFAGFIDDLFSHGPSYDRTSFVLGGSSFARLDHQSVLRHICRFLF